MDDDDDLLDATEATFAPFVEIDLAYETGAAGMDPGGWRAFEIWTRNRIYGCDWTMHCTRVTERSSGSEVADHPLLGARLSGGQVKREGALEITHPLPRPGCEAVFERTGTKGFVTTSTVTRVVLRLRVVSVPIQEAAPTWDDISRSGQRFRR